MRMRRVAGAVAGRPVRAAGRFRAAGALAPVVRFARAGADAVLGLRIAFPRFLARHHLPRTLSSAQACECRMSAKQCREEARGRVRDHQERRLVRPVDERAAFDAARVFAPRGDQLVGEGGR
jgi:hypothetical protein